MLELSITVQPFKISSAEQCWQERQIGTTQATSVLEHRMAMEFEKQADRTPHCALQVQLAPLEPDEICIRFVDKYYKTTTQVNQMLVNNTSRIFVTTKE
nr:hypothetical protein [uncultured Cohaesibacter sp.]